MIFSLLFLNLVGLSIACTDNELHARDGHVHAHAHEQRAYPQVPLMSPQVTITPPDRELVWGDFNVIQTTDSHGWLLGHQKLTPPEPNYSGNLGEFASFVKHMKDIAIQQDADLLLVDSGDVHDGTGLSEGFLRGGVDGHDLTKFLGRLPYDLMTIGNHDLNGYDKTFDMYTNFIPYLNGYYLSSNANLTILNVTGYGVSVPVGKRYAKFRTRKGRLVTSFGVLFNWTGNAHNTSVQFVEKMVNEQWFAEAIAEKPDVFVLVAHMPVSNDSWPVVVNTIRAAHSDTPILIFGGHSHIRDCQQSTDGRTIALQSGRYMDTIGWLSANLSVAKKDPMVPYTRRYLDQNRVTYEFHTKKSGAGFDTPEGLSITSDLRELEKRFNLTHVYGNAIQDYTMYQNEYPDEKNVFRLFVNKAAPYALRINNTRANISNIIIINNGVLRYDIFEGIFTKNDTLTVSPYPDKLSYIGEVPACLARQVVDKMNHPNASESSQTELELWGRGHAESRYHTWLQDMYKREAEQTTDPTNYTIGYNTTDNCGAKNDGDDTKHRAQVTYQLPQYMSSDLDQSIEPHTPIDVVFLDFFQQKVLNALKELPDTQECPNKTIYKVVLPYTSTTTDQVLPLYAEGGWGKKP